MSEIDIPRTPGSYDENINSEIGQISFVFEPDPEYGDAANAYNICVKGDRYKGGDMYFESLDEIEKFAAELNAFVRRHRAEADSQ